MHSIYMCVCQKKMKKEGWSEVQHAHKISLKKKGKKWGERGSNSRPHPGDGAQSCSISGNKIEHFPDIDCINDVLKKLRSGTAKERLQSQNDWELDLNSLID